MIGPRAFACAAVLFALAGCGDGSGPDTSTSPVGLWDFTFDGIWAVFGGTVQNQCHTEFTVKMEETGPGSPYDLQARVPFTAVPYCNGVPLQGTFAATFLLIHQKGSQLTFVVDNGGAVLVVATYRGSSMDGKIFTKNLEFLGPNFRATRHLGTSDPNEAPSFVDVESIFDQLAVGDSALVSGRVQNGYGLPPEDQTFTWSSSDTRIATVEARPPDQFGAHALVHGLKPGTVYITGTVGDAADSLQVAVLEPAADARP